MTIHPEEHIPKLIEIFNAIKQDLKDRGHDEEEAHYHTSHFFSAFDADDYDETKQKEWLEQHPDFRDWLGNGTLIREVNETDMIKCLKILEAEELNEREAKALTFLDSFIRWLEERPHNAAWMTLRLIHHWRKKYYEEIKSERREKHDN